MADSTESAPETPAKKSGGSLLLIIVLVNTLALVGGGVYLVFFFKPALAAPAPAAEGHAEPKEVGPLVELESIVANLAEPGVPRFLKVTIHLEVSDEKAVEELERELVPIRSTALFYLSSLTTDDTMGTEKKEAVREALLEKIHETTGNDLVRRVYFTEFVVQ